MIDNADNIQMGNYPLSPNIPNTCRQIHTNSSTWLPRQIWMESYNFVNESYYSYLLMYLPNSLIF